MKPWELLKTDEKCLNKDFEFALDTTRKIFNQSFLQPSKERKCFSKIQKFDLKEG